MTEQRVGYKLVNDETQEVAQSWGGILGLCPGIPQLLLLPNGDQVAGGIELGVSYHGFTLIPWMMEKPVVTVFDGADFMSRVTDAEYAAIMAAAASNVQLARWLDIFRLRGEIDVTGATAQAAKFGMVALGLMTQERADNVFSSSYAQAGDET